jgi:FkbM family methyltransferase
MLFDLLKLFRERRVGASHFTSNCQEADDLILNHIFRELPPPTKENSYKYVEVGANDAFSENISFSLAKQGWTGVSIDADPIHEDSYATRTKFLKEYNRFICAAIGFTDNEIIFTRYKNTFLNSSINQFKLRAQEDNEDILEHVPMTTISLNDIFSSLEYSHVELLSINTRGADLEILKTLDLDKFNVDVIRIEMLYAGIQEITDHPTYKYLYSAGYRLVVKMLRVSFWIKPKCKAADWMPRELLI